ncbi:DUF6199 family natural product biosynthesis protein [Paenibacillus segetis]|uniref:DUF6199 domain-containing protein n=1 Tax=Paenibacillus segetis TaxID=1325360 RepID=A0ABQ1Y8V8_9BACL|nr:DUF6199 family natural product biosynthesis protein [Paenibacillus segetis]GGH17149.1 hypothetical protein GCM10008013_12340 [Paenibacillus segetis]
MGFFLFLFILLALLNIFFPRIGWYMRYGWTIKGDVEPSDAYLLMTRISSILMLIVLFIFWSNFF